MSSWDKRNAKQNTLTGKERYKTTVHSAQLSGATCTHMQLAVEGGKKQKKEKVQEAKSQ